MRHIYEKNEEHSFIGLSDYLEESLVQEGWVGDKIQNIKNFIGKIYNYLRGKIAKIGNYFFSVSDDGSMVEPVVNPLMSQEAILSGKITDPDAVHYIGTREDKKYVNNPTTEEDIIESRGSTMKWWDEVAKTHKISESKEEEEERIKQINEKLELRHEDPNIVSVDTEMLIKLVESRIRNPKVNPLLIYGAPGVGKTQIVKNVLKAIQGENAGFLDFQLSLKEHDDFFLPTYNVDRTVAVDVPKSYLPVYKPTGNPERDKELDAKCGKGLIFLDELSQAKSQVQAVMLKLVNERILGEDYKLGSGWAVIAASNRDADEVGGHELNKALLNRFSIVNYEPMFKDWRKWAEQHEYMNRHVLDWLEIHNEYFYHGNEDSGMTATPRSWEAACKELANFANTAEDEGYRLEQIPDRMIQLSLEMNVGTQTAKMFMEYVRLIREVDINQLKKVLTDPDKAPIPDMKKLDRVYIYCSYILSFFDKDKMPTKKEFTNLMKYAARMKNESGAARLLSGILLMYPDMNNHFGKYVSKNLSQSDDTYEEGMDVMVAAYPEWASAEDLF